jgi:hypothetical protein
MEDYDETLMRLKTYFYVICIVDLFGLSFWPWTISFMIQLQAQVGLGLKWTRIIQETLCTMKSHCKVLDMYSQCPSCGDFSVGDVGAAGEEGARICESCGLVIAEGELRTELEYSVADDGKKSVVGEIVSNGSRKRSKLRYHIKDDEYNAAKYYYL